ncbi:S-methyl-5'-thioadenosine phosphorylase [Candidatus Pacearchaeota archaeon]|nr:S-methyl-5'-thioadenosine phosphorylase [Candidatus Pacearchaeota archaeon]
MKIGIIGGSGLEDPKIIKNSVEKEVETPYGKTSSSIVCGKISEIEVCIIARHGKKHEIPPTHVNNRANIFALKKLGCTHILATSAVGSLREEIKRGDFVILDQFLDFTRHRQITFYDNFKDGPKHISLANPFSEVLREKIIYCCNELGISYHEKGTVVTIEGPRFSTRAESNMFRQWGADVINMSIAPEAILAREAELEYAAIAMSTDYDCWKTDEKPVTWEQIVEIFAGNAEKMKQLLVRVIEKMSRNEEDFIKSKIRTVPHWPKLGVMFRDITTLIKDAEGFKRTIELLEKRYRNKEIDLIAGIESRGFIVASALASKLGKGIVLVRKPGKLPAEKVREEYELEYGKDAIEIHKDAISSGQKVLLVDDLCATGGTCGAAASLIEKLGGKIVECSFIVDLPELGGSKKIKAKWPFFSILEFEGE